MRKLLYTLITLTCSLGLHAIGSSSDFKTINSASELKAMPATGLTNVQPTPNQIAGFMMANPAESNKSYDIYQTNAAVTAPYTPATLKKSVIENGLKELNTIRYTTGVSSTITYTETTNDMAAKAALITAINNRLNHEPTRPYSMSDNLYNDAYKACGIANLGMGYTNIVEALQNGWMRDAGIDNIQQVGHRMWCLNPRLNEVGFGMAKNKSNTFSAMYIQTKRNLKYDNFISVPWPAVNTPLGLFSQGSPFSFMLFFDKYNQVQLGSEVCIYMLRKRDNRLFKFRMVQGNVKNNDGIAFKYDALSDCKILTWCPSGYEGYIYQDGDELDIYITGFYVDSKPYPIKYTVRFFDEDKVTADRNYQSSVADYPSNMNRKPITSSSSSTASSSSSSSTSKGQMTWRSGEFSTKYERRVWDISGFMPQSGNYSITFQYTSGGNMLVCKNAVIESSGVHIAKFPDEVSAGFNPRSWTYTFNIYSKPKKVLLYADVRTDGGTNSNGTITIVRNGYTTASQPALQGSLQNTSASSSASSAPKSASSVSSSASPVKGTWEQPSRPISIPNGPITYNKGAMKKTASAATEAVPFGATPKIVEFTTGRITKPTEYLQRHPYPTNKDAQTVNPYATRGDRVENGVLYIAEGTTTVYKNAYKGRSDITKVVLPTSLKVIGDYAFANMPNLQTVESKVRNSYQSVRYIGDHAFDMDLRLTSFPELSDLEYLGVCSFREVALNKTKVQAYFIGDSAFIGSALESVGWISVIAIGDYAFKDCKNLREWKFEDNPYLEYVGHGAFLGTSIQNVDLREGINVGIQSFEQNVPITWRVTNSRVSKSGSGTQAYPTYAYESKTTPKMVRENYFKILTDVNDFSIYMPEGYDPVKDVDVPLVLYLHGRSMSQDLPPATQYGPAIALRDGYRIFHDKKVLLVCPSADSKEGWSSAKLHKLYEFLKAHYAFNHKQFYVIGLSMGGWGTMNYVNRYPDEVAACVAICGGCDATSPCGLNKVPTWIIHAKDDDQTSVTYSDRVVSAMKQCGSINLLQYNRLEEGGHSLIYFFTYSNLYDWLFSHKNTIRQFNRSIDFVKSPDYDIDEAHFGLYTDFDYLLSEDIDITSQRLTQIKQRTPNPQR